MHLGLLSRMFARLTVIFTYCAPYFEAAMFIQHYAALAPCAQPTMAEHGVNVYFPQAFVN
jgi:hypothetical protein